MESLEAARRLTKRAVGIAIAAVVVALVLLAAVYERQATGAARLQARALVAEQLNLVTSELQGRIDADVQLLRGVGAVVSTDPHIGADRFALIGAELLGDRAETRVIVAAPGGVISMVYPQAGYDALIGRDLSPGQGSPAPETASISLSGPKTSRFGGDVFSLRTPVLTGAERSHWGDVALVIDAKEFFRVPGLAEPGVPLDIAAELVSDTGSKRVVFGDPNVLREDAVETDVRVPGGVWRIAAAPQGGWPQAAVPWKSRLAFAAFGGVLIAGLLAAAHLISSRQRQLALIKEREAELSQLSWRFEFALASSNIGLWDVDLATDELFWDARAKALFGRTGEQRSYYGLKDWLSILHPDDRARALAEADAAVDRSGRFATCYRIALPNGATRHIRDIARVHEAEDGSRRLVGLIWDVTEEVERQEELELRRVEAEAATVAKSRFLASMSHEIRTPMSGVLGVLGLMLEDSLPPQQRERAQIALSSAESLLDILDDILDFSKLEAAEVALGEEPVEIRRLVEQVMDLMSPNAIRKGLSFGHVVSAAVPRFVLADPTRVRQILTNFLSNATKFTDRGEISVRVDYVGATTDGRLVIEVEDTGIGVSAEDQERIFHRFIQADDSLARRAGGTGLGLAISSQLAELMGGRVTLQSVAGMGSTFRFEFPSRAVLAEQVKGEERPSRDAVPPMSVLLAEDHATNQYVISAYLRGAGHEVTIVANGAEALRAVRERTFDVVLMDVQMPVMDGLAAAAAIRALGGAAATVPILALTASAMPGDREACLAAGMNGHLTKPIAASALYAALGDLHAAATALKCAPSSRSLRTGTD